jgi:hypothetical protein
MGTHSPYHPDNMSSGGGRWDEQVVQITGAKFIVDLLKYKDGRPVPQKRDGKDIPGTQAFKNIILLKGIPVGKEKEQERKLSTGGMVPSADGEMLVPPPDRPTLQLNDGTDAGKFFAGLTEAGFDVDSLYPKISALVGTRLLFKEDPVLDGKGQPKKSKDGRFTETVPVPLAVVEGGTSAPVAEGNGATDEADKAILELLESGPQTKVQVLAALSAKFAGNPLGNSIIGAVVDDGYHKDKPWKFDGTTLSKRDEA